MSQFLDLLLKADLPNMQKSLPEGTFEVPRLSEAAGTPVRFALKGLPYGRVAELREVETDSQVHILLAGCPELKDPALQEKFEAATPAEAVKALLLPGEIDDLSREVEKLCGYRRRTIQEVKND